MANESWKIEGEYFESCNCELLCPCLLSQAKVRPTEGHCDVVLAFHINRGSYGKTDLSGLNAVQAFTTPGPVAQGGGTDVSKIGEALAVVPDAVREMLKAGDN